MKERSSSKNELKRPDNQRAQAVRQILSLTQLIRRRGTPDEADEAIEWERQLQRRLEQIESEPVATAA